MAAFGTWLKDNAVLLSALIALLGVLGTLLVNMRLGEESRQENELQTYLDDMGQMVLDEDNRLSEAEPGDPISNLGRAKTLTILQRLDAERKRIVLQFLYESDLIDKDGRVLDLWTANLRGADLTGALLKSADLSGTDLTEANLRNASLEGAALRNAYIVGADLSNANLRDADLRGAGKYVTGEGLVPFANEELEELERQPRTLEGATMPDGTTHD
jgi:uncharacterized protein YjbI with pentapeptide repeats